MRRYPFPIALSIALGLRPAPAPAPAAAAPAAAAAQVQGLRAALTKAQEDVRKVLGQSKALSDRLIKANQTLRSRGLPTA